LLGLAAGLSLGLHLGPLVALAALVAGG